MTEQIDIINTAGGSAKFWRRIPSTSTCLRAECDDAACLAADDDSNKFPYYIWLFAFVKYCGMRLLIYEKA